jgi:hypothetical protein
MLSTTIDSYLYTEYADDDDLQAFVSAYNQATQYYVDWFNTVGLAFYPGLSGPLLDWVAEGLYGLEKTSLATPASAALGMFNTVPFNTIVFNGYTPSTETYYSLSDDVFQRILTWDFFKGDGKRFSIRWLKRRIMRFIVGMNGIDPEPWNPGFVVGAENTQAIAVSVLSGVLTVTINQTLLSRFVQVTPGILTLFQLAFEGQVLDLPVQYTYACNIVSSLIASVTPNQLSSENSTFTQTTALATVSVFAGSGEYTYSWIWASGGSGISINSPNAAVTNFTATGLVYGQTVQGLALCSVLDTVTLSTGSASVYVTISCVAPPDLLAENGNWLLTESGQSILLESFVAQKLLLLEDGSWLVTTLTDLPLLIT